MLAEEAKKLAEENTLFIQINRLIEVCARSGERKIDVGEWGRDLKFCLPHEEEVALMEEFKKSGFKVEERVNGHKLNLAWIISW